MEKEVVEDLQAGHVSLCQSVSQVAVWVVCREEAGGESLRCLSVFRNHWSAALARIADCVVTHWT